MQFLSADSDGWASLEDEAEGEETERRTQTQLRQILAAERLVVLAGLGTSLAVGDAGRAPAPSMKDLWDRAKDKTKPEIWDAALTAARWPNDSDENIELLLSRCQMELSLSPDARLMSFIEDCEAEIVAACRFLEPETFLPAHQTFLRRVARRPARLPRAQLFTTNYDLAFETAAAASGFVVVDGFSYAAPRRFDGRNFDIDFAVRDRERAASAVEWLPNVFHLLKLHGSVDWRQVSDGGVVRSEVPEKPLIIYPRSTKFELSYQQPFLELMARYQASLRRADTGFLALGSGLADRHLAEPFIAAVRGNPRFAAIVVSPSLSESSGAHIKTLRAEIDSGNRRLAFLEASFEELAPMLPGLVPDASEDEEHVSGES